jgi:putative two-component system response regulator
MNRILVVDDELATLRQISLQLNPPYEVLLAKSGRMALNICHVQKPDLILLDLEMPFMNGFETLSALKNDPDPVLRAIPVIILTMSNETASEIQGLKAGAVDFVTKPVYRSALRRRVALHLQLVRYCNNLENTIQELEDSIADSFLKIVAFKSDQVGNHTFSTSAFVKLLTDELRKQGSFEDELTEETAAMMARAVRFHDIGMIGVSDLILRKPGKLTPEEYVEVQKHTLIGGEVMAGIAARYPDQNYMEYARLIAEGHHERYDGSGYPRGLVGEAIPLCCRIVSVANVYDACTTNRIYRPGCSPEQARSIVIRGTGSEFDPRVVSAFERIQDICADEVNDLRGGGGDFNKQF